MDMSENTKNELDPQVGAALFYLKTHCSKNATDVQVKYIKSTKGKIVAICKGDNGTYASIGVNEKRDLKIFMEDKKVHRWALMEGFTEEQIYQEMESDVIKEVSLLELAKELVA